MRTDERLMTIRVAPRMRRNCFPHVARRCARDDPRAAVGRPVGTAVLGPIELGILHHEHVVDPPAARLATARKRGPDVPRATGQIGGAFYQTSQWSAGAMGAPAGHRNAEANSGRLDTTPFTRKRGGACSSVRV